MMKENNDFIPALGNDHLTFLYDNVIECTMPEEKFRSQLVDHLAPQKAEKIMEVGIDQGQNLELVIEIQDQALYYGLDITQKAKTLAQSNARTFSRSGRHYGLALAQFRSKGVQEGFLENASKSH